jgi:hypothetical protein
LHHLPGAAGSELKRLKTWGLRSDTNYVNGVVFIWVLLSPFVVVGCLKGRYALSIVGLFLLFGIPAVLAGTRLARPDSWWAKRKYGAEQLALAAHRYPGHSRLNDALTL